MVVMVVMIVMGMRIMVVAAYTHIQSYTHECVQTYREAVMYTEI